MELLNSRKFLIAGLCLATFAVRINAANSYLIHNLVSDLPDMADHMDPNLVNPWGIGFSTTSPFWIGNNHSGTSTLYDGTGTPSSLVVTIPTPSATTGGAVTGTLFNSTQSFAVAAGKPASFIFCSEDGTITGWNSSINATAAQILFDNSKSGAVYKGCVIGGTSAAPILYGANFNAGTIDVWDGNLKPVTSPTFVDSTIPSGFAPFNVAIFNGKLYVTYAKQDAQKMDDVPGVGNGYITVFDPASGTVVSHLVAKGPLNSPWGMQIAPASFGDFGGKLLVGNFGDGLIHAFDPTTGVFAGTLNDSTGHPFAMPGLWALQFGNGGRGGDTATLYFTAGIAGPYGEDLESHGLFGSIQPAPTLTTASIVNGASFTSSIAPNTWATIIGGALSATTRGLATTDITGNKLPTTIDGVTVTVNGEPAYLNYVSPTAIDFLIPTDAPLGPVTIQLNNNGLAGSVSTTLQAVAPSLFYFGGNKYVAATHANGSIAAPANLVSGVPSTPVKPGETISLYVNGLGVTNPAAVNGGIVYTPEPLVATPTVTIGGVSATVSSTNLVEAGVYLVVVQVPANAAAGDAPVVLSLSGSQSQANAFLSIASN